MNSYISDIILDEEIYPRGGVDQKRVGIFAENIRDGFKFDPIEVQTHPDLTGKYRILDGVHRWSAYKAEGTAEPEVIIKNLDGVDPLLYAAKKAIGPRQLNKEETRETARRAFQNKSAVDEDSGASILIDDYLRILNKTGWRHTHIIQAPMSSERFTAGVVSAMQKKRILGVTSRYVIVLKQ